MSRKKHVTNEELAAREMYRYLWTKGYVLRTLDSAEKLIPTFSHIVKKHCGRIDLRKLWRKYRSPISAPRMVSKSHPPKVYPSVAEMDFSCPECGKEIIKGEATICVSGGKDIICVSCDGCVQEGGEGKARTPTKET